MSECNHMEANKATEKFGFTVSQALVAMRRGWIRWKPQCNDILLCVEDIMRNLGKIKRLPE